VILKPEVQQYLQRVKAELKHSGDCQLEYYGGFEKEVESFLEADPQVSAKTVEQFFGSPSSVARDFLDTLPDDEIRQKVFLRERIFRFARIAIIVVAVVLALLAGYFVYDNYSFTHGETVYTVSDTAPIPESSNYRTY